jgi:hypothetical protein
LVLILIGGCEGRPSCLSPRTSYLGAWVLGGGEAEAVNNESDLATLRMESILVSKRLQKNRMGILTPTPNYKEAPYMYRKIFKPPVEM